MTTKEGHLLSIEKDSYEKKDCYITLMSMEGIVVEVCIFEFSLEIFN